MKRFVLLLVALTATLIGTLHAQDSNPQRVFIYIHGMNPAAYWSSQIDSIKFNNENLDLSVNPEITPNPTEVGKAHFTLKSGNDVLAVKILLIESAFLRENMSDEDIMGILSGSSDKIWTIEPNKEYDFEHLQRKCAYTLLVAGLDKYGVFGTPVQKDFTMPDYPLLNNPKVEVEFSNPTFDGFTVQFTPNDAVKEYFYLAGTIDRSLLGKITIKQYVVQYGGDFFTKKGHSGAETFEYKGFKPSTEYPLYLVLRDKNDQLSDVFEYKARTKEKGTDKEAIPTIEVKEITSSSARVIVNPDENTSVFRALLVEKSLYDTDPKTKEYVNQIFESEDSPMNPFFVDTDDHVWENLKSDTEYYVLARAKNAKSEWGAMQQQVFKTLKGKSTRSANAINGVLTHPRGNNSYSNAPSLIETSTIE